MSHTLEELCQLNITPCEIKHNQHRRAPWQDYNNSALYMITICTDGRRPLFGTVTGNIREKRNSPDFPHVELSLLGQIIRDNELPKIHHFYPQVEVWQTAIMPDHIHLLLRVTSALPRGRQIGDVISGFKGGCSKAWWHLQEQASAPVPSSSLPLASVPASFDAGPHVPLFEPGYHDRIIRRPGMLDNIKRYIADNPLRALMRRQFPRLLERRMHLRVGAHEYAAFGGLFLLKRSEKEQVFYHRRDKETGVPTETTGKFRSDSERQLAEAREGVVLVSPAISRGEQIVIDAAIKEGLPVIHLQKEPITQYWKPELSRFEACARGTLLILYPLTMEKDLAPEPNGTETPAAISDYARFHYLNALASEICATTEAALLNVH